MDLASFSGAMMWGGSATAGGAHVGADAGAGGVAGVSGVIELVVMSENFAPNASAARRAAIAEALLSETAVLKVLRPDGGTNAGNAVPGKRAPDTISSAKDGTTWPQITAIARNDLDATGSIV